MDSVLQCNTRTGELLECGVSCGGYRPDIRGERSLDSAHLAVLLLLLLHVHWLAKGSVVGRPRAGGFDGVYV